MKKFVRKHDTVVLLGFAAETRNRVPWNNPDVDFVSLNECYHFDWFKQKPENVTAWMQIHKRESFMRPDNHNDPHHAEWLQQKHPFPILMLEEWDDIPSSMRFPIEEITKKFGTYWRSTLAYLLAWAYLQGYKRAELYGFEMASDAEYWGQRANACYIIGKLRGMGMEIYVPPTSRLLTGIRYAYENNMVGARQDLEVNLTKVKNDRAKVEAETQALQGEYLLLKELLPTHPELKEQCDKMAVELKNRDNAIHLMKGRAQGIVMAMKMFDTFSLLENESGEIDE